MQVAKSGSSTLVQLLLKEAQNSQCRLCHQLQSVSLLHLCEPEQITNELEINPDAMQKLNWKQIAVLQPELAVTLLDKHLSSAQDDEDLSRRCQQVGTIIFCRYMRACLYT